MRTALAAAAFALVVVVFFSDVLFTPGTLLDANPYHFHPWMAYASEDDLEGESYRTDALMAYFPRRVELTRSIRSGRLPMWDPKTSLGMPFFADPQSRVLYPVSLLLAFADPAEAMGYDIAIHLFIAMLGMYLFLSAVGATTLGSMIGAFAFGFSSFFYVRFGHPTLVAAGSWIPFFLYGFEKARQCEWRGTLLLAFFLVMGYLAGFPQVFLFGIIMLIAYALYLGIRSPAESRGKTLLATVRILGVSGCLSLLIVSVQLLPFIEYIKNSIGLGYDFEKMRDVFLTPPLLLLRGLFPLFFGNPVEGTDWSGLLRETVDTYNPDFTVYCGIGTLMLCLGGLVFIRKSQRAQILLSMLIASILVATAPFAMRIAYSALPLFRVSKVSRISVVGCVALSALAGMGISAVSRQVGRRTDRVFVLVAVVVVAVMIAAALIFAFSADSVMGKVAEKARSVPETLWKASHPQRRLSEIIKWIGPGEGPAHAHQEWLAYERRQLAKALVLAAVNLGLIAAFLRWGRGGGRRGMALGLALLACVALDAGLTGRSYFIKQTVSGLPRTEGITVLTDLLGDGGWRVRSLKYRDVEIKTLPANTNGVFGVSSLDVTSTMLPRSHGPLARELRSRRMDSEAGLARERSLTYPLDDLLCVRYLLVGASTPGPVPSAILRAIVNGGDGAGQAAGIRLGGETRRGIIMALGGRAEAEAFIPRARALDLLFGLRGAAGGARDSVVFYAALENESGRAEIRRRLMIQEDGNRWHRARLDLSSMRVGPGKVSFAIMAYGTETQGDLHAAWAEPEFVLTDCSFEKSGNGYEIHLDMKARLLGLALTSECREVRIEVFDRSPEVVSRWVAFPSFDPARHIVIPVRASAGDKIRVESDSAFVLRECSIVSRYPAVARDNALLYYGDMQIYENMTALEKGICVERGSVAFMDSAGETLLTLPPSPKLAGAICGRCRIVSSKPETIVLEVHAEKDCYLLYQDGYYPGWTAVVDGRRQKIERTDLGIRAIKIDEGDHRVVMAYRPLSVRVGLLMTIAGLILSVLYAFKAKNRQE